MTTLPIDRLHAAVLAAEPPAPFRVERSERGGFVVKHIDGSELRGLSCGTTAAAFADTANEAYVLGWIKCNKAIADGQRILKKPDRTAELCEAVRALIRKLGFYMPDGPSFSTDDEIEDARKLLEEVERGA